MTFILLRTGTALAGPVGVVPLGCDARPGNGLTCGAGAFAGLARDARGGAGAVGILDDGSAA